MAQLKKILLVDDDDDYGVYDGRMMDEIAE
mgnify:CR=1 FL=1